MDRELAGILIDLLLSVQFVVVAGWMIYVNNCLRKLEEFMSEFEEEKENQDAQE